MIDAYHGNTPDKSSFNGHYYSDKAPGTVTLALPAFATTAGLLELADVPLDSDLGWLTSSWVATAASNGLLAALGGVALFAWLSRHVQARSALVTVLVLILGAGPLPYATMLLSHALVVGLLGIAIWSIDRHRKVVGQGSAVSGQFVREFAWVDEKTSSTSVGQLVDTGTWRRIGNRLSKHRWDLLAGHACGWALASEYTAGIVVGGLFFWLTSMRLRRLVPFCLGAALPLLLIPAYSFACFGNPFILPYSLSESFPAMREGLYAIKWPDPETAFNLLFSPARGLLFWTPFLFMAGVGYWKLSRESPQLFWLTYAVPLLQVIVISGRVWDWPAGPILGPRYLSPILPLMALPCALGVQRFPKLSTCLAAYSILATTLATLTDACPDYDRYRNPLFDLHIPLLLKGEFSPNLGMALGLPPYASIALFYAVLIGGICWMWRRLPKEDEPSASSANESASAPAK